MPAMDFYNENLNRGFPFATGSGFAAVLSVVDCGVVMGLGSGFVADEHVVYLSEMVKAGDTIKFVLRSDAPGLAGTCLVFTRQADDGRWVTEFVDEQTTDEELSEGSEESAASEESDGCPGPEPLWSGYMVTGDMGQALSVFSGDGSVYPENLTRLEPSVVDSVAETIVSRIGLANMDRTRSGVPEGCDDLAWDFPLPAAGEAKIAAACLLGHLRFIPGYSSLVAQDLFDNRLVLGASPGQGLGFPCEQTTMFSGEAPPAGRDTLDGGLLCGQAIKSIAGLPGPVVVFSGKDGVTVGVDPDNLDGNGVLVNFHLSGLSACWQDPLEAP